MLRPDQKWSTSEIDVNFFLFSVLDPLSILHSNEKIRSSFIVNDLLKKRLMVPMYQLPDTIKFDNDPYLLAFKNGVLDLKSGNLRPIVSTDYISQWIKFDYHPIAEHVLKNCETMVFLRKIFMDQEIFDYAMLCYSTALVGKGVHYVFVSTGDGRNGKGTHRYAHVL